MVDPEDLSLLEGLCENLPSPSDNSEIPFSKQNVLEFMARLETENTNLAELLNEQETALLNERAGCQANLLLLESQLAQKSEDHAKLKDKRAHLKQLSAKLRMPLDRIEAQSARFKELRLQNRSYRLQDWQ